jgi:hypothetical protein
MPLRSLKLTGEVRLDDEIVPLSDGWLGVGSPYPNRCAAPAGSGLPDWRISANFRTKPEVIRGMSVLECSRSHRTMWFTLYQSRDADAGRTKASGETPQ